MLVTTAIFKDSYNDCVGASDNDDECWWQWKWWMNVGDSGNDKWLVEWMVEINVFYLLNHPTNTYHVIALVVAVVFLIR